MKTLKHRVRQIALRVPGSVFVYMSARKLLGIPRFFKNLAAFRVRHDGRFPIRFVDFQLCLTDWTTNTDFEPHYTYHPAWAARIVARNKPAVHIDISSTLHFSTIVSAFVPVKFYDYRPALLNLEGLESSHADLTALPFPTDSVESISCMHTVEHIGLGRYGDPIDPQGDVRAAKELARVLAKGGSLIFVTPVGRPKISFNAHRVYSYAQVMDLFPGLTLREFSIVPDNFKETGLVRNADPDIVSSQDWGCGCFEFTKQ